MEFLRECKKEAYHNLAAKSGYKNIAFTSFTFSTKRDSCDDTLPMLILRFERDETDMEKSRRIKDEERTRLFRIKDEEQRLYSLQKKEERELEEYERLKKKFG